MTIAQIELLYTEAIAALDAGDFDTAIRKAQAAKLRLATTPNLARTLGGGGSQSLAWAGAAAIDSFIAECRKAKAQKLAENAGLQQTKITYVRPESSDDF